MELLTSIFDNRWTNERQTLLDNNCMQIKCRQSNHFKWIHDDWRGRFFSPASNDSWSFSSHGIEPNRFVFDFKVNVTSAISIQHCQRNHLEKPLTRFQVETMPKRPSRTNDNLLIYIVKWFECVPQCWIFYHRYISLKCRQITINHFLLSFSNMFGFALFWPLLEIKWKFQLTYPHSNRFLKWVKPFPVDEKQFASIKQRLEIFFSNTF